jgi:thiol-disulfide isomerase/thioredoxin
MSVVAYHFWSPTCAPCVALKPAAEDLKEEFPQVQWITINTHDDKENFAQTYGVRVVPTIVFEAKDSQGTVLLTEKNSGTNIAGYYRILRNALRISQQS